MEALGVKPTVVSDIMDVEESSGSLFNLFLDKELNTDVLDQSTCNW